VIGAGMDDKDVGKHDVALDAIDGVEVGKGDKVRRDKPDWNWE
jgi:hypothetical protein